MPCSKSPWDSASISTSGAIIAQALPSGITNTGALSNVPALNNPDLAFYLYFERSVPGYIVPVRQEIRHRFPRDSITRRV
jgi:hypothetical protein